MKLKKIVSAMLIMTLFPMGMGITVFGADDSADDTLEIGMTEVKITENGGLVNFDYGNNDIALLKTEDSGVKLRNSVNSSSSYNTDLDNLSYVTEPKDQGYFGTCWAFSATSCLETLLMKETGASNPDFSELHPALAMSKSFLNDGAGYIGRSYSGGGNCDIYAMYSTRAQDTDGNIFIGPVDQSEMPIDEGKVAYTLDSSAIEVIDAEVMNIDTSDGYFPGTYSAIDITDNILDADQMKARNNIIKEFVDKYGSVSVSTYCGALSGNNYENYKETDDYSLFYQSTPGGANHAVTIVGYDDSFPASNFSDAGFDEPAFDGAFVVKNSWGTDWSVNGGYFYISYASYIDRIYAFGDLTARNTYDYEYDYTPYMPVGAVGYTSSSTGNNIGAYANHFEKQSEGKEKINRISVYVASADSTLILYVDSDDTDGTDDTDGEFNNFQLVEVKGSDSSAYTVNDDGTITVPYAGNYVFELKEPIEVTSGFTVAVYGESVVYDESSSPYPVAYERTYGSYVNHKYSNNSYMASTMDNTFKKTDEISFNGVSGYELDFMIRAYTEEVPVDVTIDGTTYEADYGEALSDVLSDNNISEVVYETVSGEANSYRAADTSMTLTKDITLFTGSYISAPTIEMNNYQRDETDNLIRFVGEITDNFETDLSGVEEVTALGFVYSADGDDTTINRIECTDLFEELEEYSRLGNDVYLFKSDELEEGSYTVSAYVSYSLTGSDDVITVYTAEKSIRIS